MTITDTINNLFEKHGVAEIVIGRVPKTNELYVKVGQVVPTGPNAENHLQITHQVSGASVPEMLERVGKQAEHANQLKGIVVDIKRRN